jgi:hypothetical protein
MLWTIPPLDTIARCEQVFTGILPYDGGDKASIITDIRLGKRPPRPRDPSQNQWLQDHVWNTITACWSGEPAQRYELTVMYRVFLKHGMRGGWNVKMGNFNTHNDRNLMIAETS